MSLNSDLWLLTSPILLHNMSNPSIIRLTPLKTESNDKHSPLNKNEFPIAKAISISRIASEHSITKKYQSLFISALKLYFKCSKRILQQGDLIALPIKSDKSMFLFKEGENGTVGEIQDEIQDFELPNASSTPTAIAYFSVTKLELPSGTSGTGLASGRYGCHIDPSTTTMVQTGLTNSPVPDAFGYLGIGKSSTFVITAAWTSHPTKHTLRLYQLETWQAKLS